MLSMSKAKGNLSPLLEFIKFTNLFQQVERVVLINGKERWENDAEHSFQLAIVAWFIVDQGKFDLDLGRVIRLALADFREGRSISNISRFDSSCSSFLDETTVMDPIRYFEAFPVPAAPPNSTSSGETGERPSDLTTLGTSTV